MHINVPNFSPGYQLYPSTLTTIPSYWPEIPKEIIEAAQKVYTYMRTNNLKSMHGLKVD